MFGLIYDVHGNLPALDAVLADAGSVGVERFVLGGDYALFGAWPLETVERLRELDATWIRGNGERWTASPEDAPEEVRGAIARCRDLLGSELVADLASLPETHTDAGTLYCHGSPVSDVRSFMPESSDEDAELLLGSEPVRVVFGHTHLAFHREGPGAIDLFNPGSVGMPLDGDHRAAWGLVRDDGGLEHRRAEYDFEASAAAVRERLGEAGEEGARRIERASLGLE